MGCIVPLMFCAGVDFSDQFPVPIVQWVQADEGCGVDPFTLECGFPIDLEEPSAISMCCGAGSCCMSLYGLHPTIPIACFNSSINLCEVQTCLSDGDRCEVIEEEICDNGYTPIAFPPDLIPDFPELPPEFDDWTGELPPQLDPELLCDYRPTEVPTTSPTIVPSSQTESPTLSPTTDDNGDDDDDDDASGSDDDDDDDRRRALLEKHSGVDLSNINSDTRGKGWDRIVSINGQLMTVKEFITSNDDLSDKMKRILGPEKVEKYENLRNGN